MAIVILGKLIGLSQLVKSLVEEKLLPWWSSERSINQNLTIPYANTHPQPLANNWKASGTFKTGIWQPRMWFLSNSKAILETFNIQPLLDVNDD